MKLNKLYMIDLLKKYINSKIYCLKFLDYHITGNEIKINKILVGNLYDNIRIATNQNQGDYYCFNHTIPLNNEHTYTFTVNPENYNDFANLFGIATPRNNYNTSHILMDDTPINRHD